MQKAIHIIVALALFMNTLFNCSCVSLISLATLKPDEHKDYKGNLIGSQAVVVNETNYVSATPSIDDLHLCMQFRYVHEYDDKITREWTTKRTIYKNELHDDAFTADILAVCTFGLIYVIVIPLALWEGGMHETRLETSYYDDMIITDEELTRKTNSVVLSDVDGIIDLDGKSYLFNTDKSGRACVPLTELPTAIALTDTVRVNVNWIYKGINGSQFYLVHRSPLGLVIENAYRGGTDE